METVLAPPRGSCARVVRVIDIVERTLELYGPRAYVFHEIAHNRHVVQSLQERGAVFIDDLARFPERSVREFGARAVGNDIVRRETTSFRLPKLLRAKIEQSSPVSET